MVLDVVIQLNQNDQPLAVEVVVQDFDGARVALESGADRVELCAALVPLSGLTPSMAVIEAVVGTGIPTHVLVRPRGGGFAYSPSEVSVMKRDIEMIVDAGASGVVIGALTPDFELDVQTMKVLMRAAQGRAVTVHHCLDATRDPLATLERIVDLGATRVLTSGGATTAAEGVEGIERMVSAADGRVEVMAAIGVTPDQIALLAATGIDAVHLAGRRFVGEAGSAFPGGGSATHEVTDQAQVRAAVVAAANARA